jgi:hypothetical protein
MADHTHPFLAAPAADDTAEAPPPVPITVWPVPAAVAGETLSFALAQRLIASFTHERLLVIDLTRGPALGRALHAARRRHLRRRSAGPDGYRATLIVAGWPQPHTDATALFAGCADRLMPDGCIVVVLDTASSGRIPALLMAAGEAGLTCREHIMAVPEQAGRDDPGRGDRPGYLVHSDALIFSPGQDHHG